MNIGLHTIKTRKPGISYTRWQPKRPPFTNINSADNACLPQFSLLFSAYTQLIQNDLGVLT